MRAVYYSLVLTESAAKYQRQWLRSIGSLRKFNKDIAVHLFVFNNPSAPLIEAAETHSVALHRLGDYNDRLTELAGEAGAALACIPTLNKLIPLGHLGPDTSQILFLDCDTIIFGDVEALFSKYREADWYAREEIHSRRSKLFEYRRENQDEEALFRIADGLGTARIPPYNSGVFLLNNRLGERLYSLRADFLNYAWRLTLGAHKDPSIRLPAPILSALASALAGDRDWPDTQPIPYPSTNYWILEQVALWLTLGEIPGLSHAQLNMEDVLQNGEFLLYRSYARKCTVLHYFSGNEQALADEQGWQAR